MELYIMLCQVLFIIQLGGGSGMYLIQATWSCILCFVRFYSLYNLVVAVECISYRLHGAVYYALPGFIHYTTWWWQWNVSHTGYMELYIMLCQVLFIIQLGGGSGMYLIQ